MSFKITKHDIGAEIISILTKGIYPDPRDALREYIQNGVDAEAQNIEIKIRTDSIVIEDDGYGMDEEVLKKAVRIGISDKNPTIDVGFRGIGIYSSFHLCNRLDIYSQSKGNSSPAYLLSFDFSKMRDVLNQQQSARLQGKLKSDELIDLQSLLEKHISLSKLDESGFKKTGTRVEMVGLEPNFFKTLSKFEEVADYIQQVVPLHFNDGKFKWAKKIEDKISAICKDHDAEFKLVNLTLQVYGRIEKLFRPYMDEHFDGELLEPFFREIKNRGYFFGVAWGCLNPARKKIKEKSLRGFLIRKHGFAIGERADVGKYFGRTTFFDRYIGEVIVVHPDLLPNAARSDFEISPMRTLFYEAVSEIATFYNNKANEYQEYTKGDELLDEAIDQLRQFDANLPYYAENSEQLVEIIVQIRNLHDQIEGRLERESIRRERRGDAEKVVKIAKALEKDIQNYINQIKEKTKIKKTKTPEMRSLKRIESLPDTQPTLLEKAPQSLVEVFESLDIPVSNKLKNALELIDEKFVQGMATNKAEYLEILKKLHDDIEDLSEVE